VQGKQRAERCRANDKDIQQIEAGEERFGDGDKPIDDRQSRRRIEQGIVRRRQDQWSRS
jgi:hypothetical protein